MTVLFVNWELILLLVILVVAGVFVVAEFLKHPSTKRQKLMLTWLVQAVALAEKKYGSKTGKVKLSHVYDLFIAKYGFVGMFISQEIFEGLVDKAIKIMEETFKKAIEKLPE